MTDFEISKDERDEYFADLVGVDIETWATAFMGSVIFEARNRPLSGKGSDFSDLTRILIEKLQAKLADAQGEK